MSDLQQIGQSLTGIRQELKSQAALLAERAVWCKTQAAALSRALGGSGECAQAVSALMTAGTVLEQAAASLNGTAGLIDQWMSARIGGASGTGTGAAGNGAEKNQKNLNNAMAGYPAIKGNHSMADDLKAANPNFSRTDPDSPFNINCQRCISAYEARRRGYDVEARPAPEGEDYLPFMRHPDGWPSVYEGAELIDCSANSGTAGAINVEEQLKQWGDNVRAVVRVRWKLTCGGGGHVFIAERVNGVTHFVDPQSGSTDASGYFELAQGSGMFCMRTDNLPFTSKIEQCCTKRTEKEESGT